jgi:protein O-mannosyl-transferase
MAKSRARTARTPARTDPPPPTRQSVAWRALLIAIAGIAVYASALAYPFVFDDQATIVNNVSIRELWSPRVFMPAQEVPTAGRPLVNVAHAINYALNGEDPTGYRVVNLGLHLLCALALFALARRTLERPCVPQTVRAQALDIAFAAALLWTVHPLNTEVVEYITQRSESMMALCLLLTLYAGARAADTRHRGAWNAATIVFCTLGMACKESMVVAPLLVALWDRTFAFDSWSAVLRARWRVYAALAGTWVLLAAFIWSGPRAYSAGFSVGVTPWTYLLNQTVMIVRYLRLVVWPHGLVVAYGPTVSTLTIGDVWPHALFVGALVAATIVALARWPVVGFAGAWMFVTLAPTSSILPIATEVGAERRMYLALAAVMVLAVAALARWTGGIAQMRRKSVAIVIAIAVVLGGLSVARLREYASPLGLAETVLARWPTPFAHAIVGAELAIAGRHDEAIAQLRHAVPGYALAYYHLGGELFNRGDVAGALPMLREFVTREPWRAEAVPARTMIGRGLMLEKQWPAAAENCAAC